MNPYSNINTEKPVSIHMCMQCIKKDEENKPKCIKSHLGSLMKRRGGHQANDGGTVGVGNKCPLPRSEFDPIHGLGIHLWYHQWDLLLHPKRGAIVHHYSSPLHGYRPELLADGPAGTEESDVDAVEAIGSEFLDGVVAALEGESLPRGALGSKHFDGAEGEVAVREHREKLLTHGASDANDRERRRRLLEGHTNRCGANTDGIGLGGLQEFGGEKGMVGDGGHCS